MYSVISKRKKKSQCCFTLFGMHFFLCLILMHCENILGGSFRVLILDPVLSSILPYQSSHKKSIHKPFLLFVLLAPLSNWIFFSLHSLLFYVVTFMKGCSIFLSPPSLHFILCRCREYIPCYQP